MADVFGFKTDFSGGNNIFLIKNTQNGGVQKRRHKSLF
nr:MAG TPA: hypothetical protein [Caudoviricetes sp.]